MRNREQIMECVRHSDIVYNLVGRDYETKNFTFEHVHVDGSRAIAEAAAEAGVARFVQVSALNASEDSTSKFLRSKVNYWIKLGGGWTLTLSYNRLWARRLFVKCFLMLPSLVPVPCLVMRIVS